jgi:hypothetical protein
MTVIHLTCPNAFSAAATVQEVGQLLRKPPMSVFSGYILPPFAERWELGLLLRRRTHTCKNMRGILTVPFLTTVSSRDVRGNNYRNSWRSWRIRLGFKIGLEDREIDITTRRVSAAATLEEFRD